MAKNVDFSQFQHSRDICKTFLTQHTTEYSEDGAHNAGNRVKEESAIRL
jgi:hypothetical protein